MTKKMKMAALTLLETGNTVVINGCRIKKVADNASLVVVTPTQAMLANDFDDAYSQIKQWLRG